MWLYDSIKMITIPKASMSKFIAPTIQFLELTNANHQT